MPIAVTCAVRLRARCRRAAAGLCLALPLFVSPAMAGGDPGAGERVFRKCGACHVADRPENRVGPSLIGVIGRPVARFSGYGYSQAMTAFGADGKVWDEERLSAYLLAPRAMVPGTRMSFAGLKTDKDIADVIAYLKTQVPAK